MSIKQYSFVDLSRKCVVNVADGKELGHICDMIFNGCAQILGIIVPGKKSILRSITNADNIYIPWNRIVKIGADVILVELVCAKVPDCPPHSDNHPDCDCHT